MSASMWTQALKINMGNPTGNILGMTHQRTQHFSDAPYELRYLGGGFPVQVLSEPGACQSCKRFPLNGKLFPIVQGRDFLGQCFNREEVLLNAVGTAFVGMLEVILDQQKLLEDFPEIEARICKRYAHPADGIYRLTIATQVFSRSACPGQIEQRLLQPAPCHPHGTLPPACPSHGELAFWPRPTACSPCPCAPPFPCPACGT